jgi:hypothetical protein
MLEPKNNGSGKRIWFLFCETGKTLEERYHCNKRGYLVRCGSKESAQRKADKLNEGVKP